MFVHKTCILIVTVFIGNSVYASEASNTLRELDSIGMMQEVVVAAPRYENQDEAWLGMIEGVVVEARRPSPGIDETVVVANNRGIPLGDNKIDSMCGKSIVSIFLPLTFALATISVLYLSAHAFLIAEEVNNERTDN